MKLKVCGMAFSENIAEVAHKIHPDYMGFIFYESSTRNCKVPIPPLNNIKKTGVFVNSSLDTMSDFVKKFDLQAVQLHGQEPPSFCERLKSLGVEVIKAFSLGDGFDFSATKKYKESCHYYLFDAKGPKAGGNGFSFDWNILEEYTLSTPFFLSGGIGLHNVEALKLFLQNTSLPVYGIDINSRFEIKPGLKNIFQLEAFKKELGIG